MKAAARRQAADLVLHGAGPALAAHRADDGRPGCRRASDAEDGRHADAVGHGAVGCGEDDDDLVYTMLGVGI